MARESRSEESIIVQQGHLYLFWTMGIYYIWELAQRYRIVLIVNEDYLQSKRFQAVCRLLHIHEIHYLPKFRAGSPASHFKYNKFFKSIVARYKPNIVVQNDYIGIENTYLFHWSWRINRNCRNVVVLTSMPSTKKIQDFFVKLRRYKASLLAAKYKLPAYLFYGLMNTAKFLQSFRDNQLLPFLVLGEAPYLSTSLYNNIDNVPRKPLFDTYFVYHEQEKSYLTDLFGIKKNFSRIQCPLESIGQQCNESIYSLEEERIIAFFPSLIGIKSFADEEHMIEKWASAICAFEKKFQNYRFLIKFHPSLKNKPVLLQIKNVFQQKCPFLEILNEEENATEWIMRSKIIISDFSTTLWYVSFLHSKLAVSLDFHCYDLVRDIKNYPSIVYFDSIDEISRFDFKALQLKRKSDHLNPKENSPSLTDRLNAAGAH